MMDYRKKEMLLLNKINMEPYGEFTTHNTLSGFILPTGDRVLVVSPISGELMSLYRKQLNAKIFTVNFEITYKPLEDSFREYER